LLLLPLLLPPPLLQCRRLLLQRQWGLSWHVFQS
jgi:hypothetical protein